MILWNSMLVREWQKPRECQQRMSSCWTHSRKWSINCPLIKHHLPFAQSIGGIDQITLEAYFSRYLLVFFKITSGTFVFPGCLGEGFLFLLLLSILRLCLKRIYLGSRWSWLWVWYGNLLQNNLSFTLGIYFFLLLNCQGRLQSYSAKLLNIGCQKLPVHSCCCYVDSWL